MDLEKIKDMSNDRVDKDDDILGGCTCCNRSQFGCLAAIAQCLLVSESLLQYM